MNLVIEFTFSKIVPCRDTPWFNSDANPAHADNELIAEIANKEGPKACSYPEQIRARKVGTWDVIFEATQSGVTIDTKHQIYGGNIQEGFKCLREDQMLGDDGQKTPCEDYEVQLCCPRKQNYLCLPKCIKAFET